MQFGQLFPEATVVRIDIDPTEIDRNRAADVGLVGDCDDVFKQLLPLLERGDHADWTAKLRNAGRAFMVTELEQRDTPSHPIHPNRLVSQIMRATGDDAYYVVDGGDTSYFGLTGLRSKHKAGVLGPAGGQLGCLGTGIPFAIAGKLSHPEKPVVLLQGDGSFGFNCMEFDTCVRHDIPIVCVVNNDCAWGMIKHSQEMSIGEDRLTCAELGERHYERVVEGLGGYGEWVEKDADVVPAIERAIASGKPACINVVTDPTATSPATVLFYQSFAEL
jgi:acetolactate synthase-1/2/3 large subunit